MGLWTVLETVDVASKLSIGMEWDGEQDLIAQIGMLYKLHRSVIRRNGILSLEGD